MSGMFVYLLYTNMSTSFAVQLFPHHDPQRNAEDVSKNTRLRIQVRIRLKEENGLKFHI